MRNLRRRLVHAKLSGTTWNDLQQWQYTFRSNEMAAGEALMVVAEWLRDEAARLRQPPWQGKEHAAEFADQYERMADAIIEGVM